MDANDKLSDRDKLVFYQTWHRMTTGQRAMAIFCKQVQSNEAPARMILEYFEAAFTEILKGAEPKKALGLTRVRGRKSHRDYCRASLNAALVADLKATGSKLCKACEKVAAQEGFKPKTVAKHYARHRASSDLMAQAKYDEDILDKFRRMFDDHCSDLRKKLKKSSK